MGGPGILSTLLDTTGERVKERIAQSNKMDDEQRDVQTKALLQSIYATDETGAPKLSDREAEEAWSRIEKLHSHNKGVKDIIAKGIDITNKLFGGGRKPNPAMAGRAQDQTMQALSGGPGGPLVSAPQAPATSAEPSGPGAQPSPAASAMSAGGPAAMPDVSMPNADSDQDAADTYTGLTPPPAKVSAAPPQVAAAPAPVGPTPPPQRTSTVALMRAGAPDNPVKIEVDKEGRANVEWTRRTEINHKNKLEEIAKTAAAHGDKKIAQYIGDDGMLHMVFQSTGLEGGISTYETDSDGKVRPYVSRLSPGSHLSVTDAKSLQSSLGQEFLDESGKPIPVQNLDIKQELIPITGGQPNRYKIATQNQTTKTVNNLVVAVPTLEQSNPQAQTVLGQAQVGTESTSQVPVIDANGNMKAATMQSSSQPAGFPVPGRPPAPPPVDIPGVLPASERDKQLQVARPVRAAAIQIFGDPNNPDQESLESFADLADDPKSRARVGAAARFIINDLSAADRAGGVGASILGSGASVNGGDMWGALKNWSGLTNAISTQQAAATDAAVKNLTPRESRMLNQIMAAYGTVVGLRSLTRGGAYKFAVDSMERELPIPGISDVNSSASYNNKLAKIANEVVEGTKGISTMVLPEQEQYKEAAARLNKKGQGKADNGLTNPPIRTAPAPDKIKVRGPNGQTGTANRGATLPPGWTEIQ